ncbi:unnamed protein product [Thlaspi arvense]|uniref:WAT1-related protein n=1 Tax=Thlaspi arvense TaxID=13288 RepID=A0AAU9RJB0_THLAR|nr:unnamed protein product [Thlaspi arvense]
MDCGNKECGHTCKDFGNSCVCRWSDVAFVLPRHEVMGGSSLHWKYADKMGSDNPITTHSNFILGPFLVISSTVAWAVWFVIQIHFFWIYMMGPSPRILIMMGQVQPDLFTAWFWSENKREVFSSLHNHGFDVCLMASFQCAIIGVCVEPKASAWSLSPAIRATSSIYAGTVCNALSFAVMSWCIQRKVPSTSRCSALSCLSSWLFSVGQFFKSVYSSERSMLIIAGLYAVLWGKKREMSPSFDNVKDAEGGQEKQEKTGDLEMQFSGIPNGNFLTKS